MTTQQMQIKTLASDLQRRCNMSEKEAKKQAAQAVAYQFISPKLKEIIGGQK